MKTFVKRSIKVALSIVFIGAAVVPACAQGKKGLVKGVGSALSKKMPEAPLVSVRVPSTATGTRIPQIATMNNGLEHAVVSQMVRSSNATKNLNQFLRQKIATHTLSWDFTTSPFTSNIIHQIERVNLDFFLEKNKRIEDPEHIWRLDEFDVSVDFAQLITEDMPEFIPMGVHIDSAEDTKQMLEWREMLEGENSGIGPIKIGMLVATVEKIDGYFFVENNGQFYVNKRALTQVHSYKEALGKLAWKVSSNFFSSSLFALSKLIDFRNKQIINALNNPVNPQIDEPTTQYTAKEIKFLVENLDPDNSLRQAIEKTLKDNGYMTPQE